MVRPIFKRTNSIKDDELEDDLNCSPSCSTSRRGSRLSIKSGTSKSNALEETESLKSVNKEEVQRRWRRVLSVSKAIGRFSVLTKDKMDEEK